MSGTTMDVSDLDPSIAYAEFPAPDGEGLFSGDALEFFYAPGDVGAILLVQQADGWRAGYELELAYRSEDRPPRSSDPAVSSRSEAIGGACELVIAWCSDQKNTGPQKHRKQAGELQDWALELRKTYSPPAAAASKAATEPLPAGELRDIVLDELHESVWNPRQHYPAAAMEELTQSMRHSGFSAWLPLMVRPRAEGGYEIGAGHRRSRAARAAGITVVPCVVREMSDEQFLDVLNFDNCAREDVHPLHEAAGWGQWMEKTGKGVLEIAARIGQSREYVYQRLKYSSLTDDAKKAFLDDKIISAGHAILIARLQPPDQKKALKYCELTGYDARKKSVRDLARFIQQDIHLEMSGAKFDLTSPSLLPAAGPCTTCSKRTKNAPELIPDQEQMRLDREEGIEDPDGQDDCTDPACFQAKLGAHLVQIRAALAQEGAPLLEVSHGIGKTNKGLLGRDQYREVEATVKGAQPAVVMDGYDAGKVIHVKVLPTGSGGGSVGSPANDKAVREEAEKKRIERVEVELGIRRKILAAVRAKISGLTRADIECLVIDAIGYQRSEELCRIHGIKVNSPHQAEAAIKLALPKLSETELFQVAVEIPVMGNFSLYRPDDSPAALLALAKRYKVDAEKIRREAVADLKAFREGGIAAAFPRKATAKPTGGTPTKKKPAAKSKAKAKKK